jgi:hypothetical protein
MVSGLKKGISMAVHKKDEQNHDPEPLGSAFDALVLEDNDSVGLLAYGLYTQNGRDWIKAFLAKNGRSPNADEQAAFSLAEQMPNRLASYRLMAENLLRQDHMRQDHMRQDRINIEGANSKPITSKPINTLKPQVINPLLDPTKKAQSIRYIFAMLALVVAMAVLFRLAGVWLFS